MNTQSGPHMLEKPVKGWWPWSNYPTIIMCEGRRFKKSENWRWPYPGVVAQYREDRDRNARHMLVHADGRFVIDHVDNANPERSFELMVEHAARDVVPHLVKGFGGWVERNKEPIGIFAGVVAVGFLVGAIVRKG